ncbi:MAG: ATP-binding protein [Deltaproteobacteria bacterium]|nr:ATP-binding protein [Deltaproteobacteria bacterium]MDH4121994.1 ATP-binding protein [Deltaproteobacteria bacterium]
MTTPPAAPGGPPFDADELRARVGALEMELAQKDALLTQGFEAFTEAAEKLQQSHKKLQQKVAELNLELDQKNRALEVNLAERVQMETYLSNIFSSLDVGVVVTNLDGWVTSINRAGEEILETPADSAVGKGLNDLLGHSLVQPGSPQDAQPPLPSDEPLGFRRTGGDDIKLQVTRTLMNSEQGEPLGYIFNVRDVTALKKLEEQAQRRNRFTAMGEMAANIAHEIRNPLGSIELFATLVKKGLDESDEKTRLMNHISSSVASMNHIISNLLAYTKPRHVTRRPVDLHALLNESVAFNQVMAAHNDVEVSLHTAAPSAWVMGDKEQLKQVFTNLFVNAVQAMPEGGRLQIATRGLGGTNSLELSFQDSGQGISPEIQSQIFDPFYTTKSQGTGLGLSIVHNIVESHHAVIQVSSKPGQGARFVITFPLAEAGQQPQQGDT